MLNKEVREERGKGEENDKMKTKNNHMCEIMFIFIINDCYVDFNINV